MARKRVKVDRSDTAIPCMLVFTKPLQVAGLPKDVFYVLLGLGLMCVFLLKNMIVGIIILLLYLFLRRINEKDEYAIEGMLYKIRKKYISY